MRSVPDAPPSELMYVITRRQPWLRCSPWASRPWRPGPGRRPARLIGPTIARQAGNRLARQPGVPLEQMLRALPGENWRRSIPVGAVLATAILAGMSRVAYIDPLNGHAIHDGLTETGCAAGLGRTRIDAWDDFSPGRWPPVILALGYRRGSVAPVRNTDSISADVDGNTTVSGIWDNGNKQPIDIDRNLIDDVLDDVRREARCEMMERATTAQLRYLERLLANANTTWPMVKRRWLEAPARFDELDKQQAGALIAKLRRHGHVPANHSLGGGPPRRQDTD